MIASFFGAFCGVVLVSVISRVFGYRIKTFFWISMLKGVNNYRDPQKPKVG